MSEWLDPTTPTGIAWLAVLFVGVAYWAFRPWARRRRRRRDDGES